MPPLLSNPDHLLVATFLVAALAAWVHGFIGLGFPLITTPLLTVLTDLQTAVIATVLPNIAINILSIVRGGNWSASLGRHWPLALYVLLGSFIGTQLLIGLPALPLKVFLAVAMLVSLNLDRLKRLDWHGILQHPHLAPALFGITAGILAGTVNVSVPPLAIYFLALALTPVATVQLFNLCFIVGKLTQAISLGAAGALGSQQLLASLPLTGVCLVALFLGMRIQERLSPAAYRRWLNRTLLAMALVLLAQASWELLA